MDEIKQLATINEKLIEQNQQLIEQSTYVDSPAIMLSVRSLRTMAKKRAWESAMRLDSRDICKVKLDIQYNSLFDRDWGRDWKKKTIVFGRVFGAQ